MKNSINSIIEMMHGRGMKSTSPYLIASLIQNLELIDRVEQSYDGRYNVIFKSGSNSHIREEAFNWLCGYCNDTLRYDFEIIMLDGTKTLAIV